MDVIRMCWSKLEVLNNDVLEVKVCIQDGIGEQVVNVLDVNRWWCEVDSITLDVEL